MSVPKKYREKDSWPHQFAPTSKVRQGAWGTTETQSRCTYCGQEWWVGSGPRPTGKCPERTDKSEHRRLGIE